MKKSKLIILSFLSIGLLISSSCKKDKNIKPNSSNSSKSLDVYVAGFQNNAANSIATIWKNGVATNLTNGTKNAFAFSVAADGNDIYVVGEEVNSSGMKVAKVWKNNIPFDLTDGSKNASAHCIFITNGNIYIGGYTEIGSTQRGVLWKYNTPTTYIMPINSLAIINSITTMNGEILVTGAKAGTNANYVAINNDGMNMYNVPNLDYINKIYSSGNDLYLAGKKGNIARYVKNNFAKDLTDGSGSAMCYDICTVSNIVYSCGSEESTITAKLVSKVWKDGVPNIYSDSTINSLAISIVAKNGTTYVAVNEGNEGSYWINETKHILTSQGGVLSVYVK